MTYVLIYIAILVVNIWNVTLAQTHTPKASNSFKVKIAYISQCSDPVIRIVGSSINKEKELPVFQRLSEGGEFPTSVGSSASTLQGEALCVEGTGQGIRHSAQDASLACRGQRLAHRDAGGYPWLHRHLTPTALWNLGMKSCLWILKDWEQLEWLLP